MSVGMRKNKSDEGKTGQKSRDKIEKQNRSPRDTQKILFFCTVDRNFNTCTNYIIVYILFK